MVADIICKMHTPSATRSRAGADELAELLATFACGVSDELGAGVRHGAKRVLVDSVAVALGALQHRAARAGRRYAAMFPQPAGCRIWGTSTYATPEVAALVNGAPLRAYDYNDLYIGRAGGGHPSDLVPAVIAVAEWKQSSGEALLAALALGYDVIVALFECVDLSKAGWDYVNSTAIGATCAIARLLDLSYGQTYEALTITVTSHMASGELESGELNQRGDLTLWKRFNNGDAMRQSVYACFLALAGVEGPVRAFTGEHGFLKQIGANGDTIGRLREELVAGRPLGNILKTTLKRWPVGSRAQSAIDAALRARAPISDAAAIARVRVQTDEAAYDHLVRVRSDPWHPTSRETADHSLPYIVAAAVLDGYVKSASFSPAVVNDPQRQAFLNARVTVESSAALSLGAAAGYLTRVEIETRDGAHSVAEAAPAPGHPRHPFSDAELGAKLRENAATLYGAEQTERIAATLWSLESLADVRELTALFQLAGDEVDADLD